MTRGYADKFTVQGENLNKAMSLVGKLVKYQPEFKGPSKVEDAASDVLKVIGNSKLADGLAGAFISHFGNKQWV